LYTGKGPGKTTNALGLVLRTVAHNRKAVLIQFLKGRKDIGSYKIKDKLGSNYEIHQFGKREFVDPKEFKEEDYEMARKGLKTAKEKLFEEVNLLVLDEVNLAVSGGLLKSKDVLNLLEKIPEKTTVVLTGRHAPKELKKRADFVNEINVLKYPEHMPLEKGIQY
ncbi:MAG: cob(I)yrinic acid a,c-diamide adenosyltransferase, partial [Candidatus Aenigmatarchaeota archaeon]